MISEMGGDSNRVHIVGKDGKVMNNADATQNVSSIYTTRNKMKILQIMALFLFMSGCANAQSAATFQDLK